MDEKKVVAALRNWSPRGLCKGTLIMRNESGVDKAVVEACATGCLALEFLHAPEGAEYLAKVHIRQPEDFITTFLRGPDDLSQVDQDVFNNVDVAAPSLEAAVERYFDLAADDLDNIISFNDSCDRGQSLPSLVRETIYERRQEYQKWNPADE